jgi:DNA-binding GntR family transcriptional regulator
MALVKIEKKTLRRVVYEKLKESIIGTELLPGEVISLRGLATKLGVSLTPIREALWQLDAEGIVVIESNQSIRVNELTPAELEEVTRLRILFESAAAERACELRPDDSLPYLKSLVDDMWKSLENHKQYLRKNRLFHFGIYQLADSPLLLRMIDSLWARIGPYFTIRVIDPEHLRRVNTPCHQQMYEALAARDKKKMRQALATELGSTQGIVLPLIGETSARLEKKMKMNGGQSKRKRSGGDETDKG